MPLHHPAPPSLSPTNNTVNYLPTKFSASPPSSSNSTRKRKVAVPPVQKTGRGPDARMPTHTTRPRWNKFKWTLFAANILLTLYSFTAFLFCLLTWIHVDIVRVANRTELIISSLAASLALITSLLGWSGILQNNRPFLAVYTFLLWLCFVGLVAPGYITYKRRSFNLEGKLNAQWSRSLGPDGRLRIQNQLHCCGYFSPYVEATVTQTCYSRSTLPGCKKRFLAFERRVLHRWYTAAFAIVPLHIAIMVAGLLSSNHVTYRFGKGMMPRAYRLSLNSMAVIMDNYASQLAQQYGMDVLGARSRSNIHLDAMPTVPYDSLESHKMPVGALSESSLRRAVSQ